eukprot:CAMPEP_0179977764 /NCGR_PEP_ID=MMETSP0983-20121128/40268_1 /TAXON_ID=483367 /ORGANISM="non described non described, Strain CCMP 2436" /LENGTH=153 /DNA_ID=CAMNT_0021895043 /DNA_START=194 /DNA_END=656 /DNA_ORIENTATION=-
MPTREPSSVYETTRASRPLHRLAVSLVSPETITWQPRAANSYSRTKASQPPQRRLAKCRSILRDDALEQASNAEQRAGSSARREARMRGGRPRRVRLRRRGVAHEEDGQARDRIVAVDNHGVRDAPLAVWRQKLHKFLPCARWRAAPPAPLAA